MINLDGGRPGIRVIEKPDLGVDNCTPIDLDRSNQLVLSAR